MKTFIAIFLAAIAAVIVIRVWDAYGMTAVWVVLAAARPPHLAAEL